MDFKTKLNMSHLRNIALLCLIFLASCKSPNYSVVEPFISTTVADSDSKSQKEGGGEDQLSMPFNSPKVLEVIPDGKTWKVKLRLNGRCEPHTLKWLEISECNLEVRDMTTKDKCMGYQIVTEQLRRNKNCDEISINGVAYSNTEVEEE